MDHERYVKLYHDLYKSISKNRNRIIQLICARGPASRTTSYEQERDAHVAHVIDDGDPCEQNMCDSTLIVDAAR